MSPREAAICFTSVAIYYDPVKETPMLGPNIIYIKDYLKTFFKKTTINIVTKEDLAPLILPVCGDERNKVIVFELWIGTNKKTQRTVLNELDICPNQYGQNSGSTSGCKYELLIYAIVCSLTLNFQLLKI